MVLPLPRTWTVRFHASVSLYLVVSHAVVVLVRAAGRMVLLVGSSVSLAGRGFVRDVVNVCGTLSATSLRCWPYICVLCWYNGAAHVTPHTLLHALPAAAPLTATAPPHTPATRRVYAPFCLSPPQHIYIPSVRRLDMDGWFVRGLDTRSLGLLRVYLPSLRRSSDNGRRRAVRVTGKTGNGAARLQPCFRCSAVP